MLLRHVGGWGRWTLLTWDHSHLLVGTLIKDIPDSCVVVAADWPSVAMPAEDIVVPAQVAAPSVSSFLAFADPDQTASQDVLDQE